MDSLLEVLGQGWIGTLVGVVGVAFGILQWARRTGPRLMYQYVGQTLISDKEGVLPDGSGGVLRR